MPWRIVGVVDGTILTYEPAPPPGAPTTLAAQQLAEFDTPGPFVVRSQDAQHPFYLASYMTGGGALRRAPAIPSSSTSCRPRSTCRATRSSPIPRTRRRTWSSSACAIRRAARCPTSRSTARALLGGWQPVGTSGTLRVDARRPLDGRLPGRRRLRQRRARRSRRPSSSARFGVTVWGWGNDVTWPPDNGPADEANPMFTALGQLRLPGGRELRSR